MIFSAIDKTFLWSSTKFFLVPFLFIQTISFSQFENIKSFQKKLIQEVLKGRKISKKEYKFYVNLKINEIDPNNNKGYLK